MKKKLFEIKEVDVTPETVIAHQKSSAKTDWKQKPNSFESTHTRKTFWIRDDLLKLLNEISVYKGDQTSILNNSLEMFFKDKQKGRK